MWDLIVSVPDHCLSFYFSHTCTIIEASLVKLNNISVQRRYICNYLNNKILLSFLEQLNCCRQSHVILNQF